MQQGILPQKKKLSKFGTMTISYSVLNHRYLGSPVEPSPFLCVPILIKNKYQH